MTNKNFGLDYLYQKIFKETASIEASKFMKNLSWSFFGGISSAGILFTINVLAGRWLGPEEYGKYSLILVLAQAFTIPMLLGTDTSITRNISQLNGDNKKIKSIISSALWFIVLYSLFIVLMLFILKTYIAGFIFSGINIIILAIICGVVFAHKMFFDGIAKGMHFFRFQAIMKIIESIFVIAIFTVLYHWYKNYLSLITSLVTSGMIVIGLYLFYFRSLIGKPTLRSLKKLLQYSKFVFIGSTISLVITYGDRFVVNKYLGVDELGLYSAYYTSTVFIIGYFITAVSNVFFPTIAKFRKKNIILNKIDTFQLIGIFPLIIIMFSIGFLVMKIFGSAYPFNITILLLFSIVAVLQFFTSFYANIVNVHNEKTYLFGLIFLVLRACFYVTYIILLIMFNLVTMRTILIGLIVNYIVDICNLRYIIKKYA